MRASAFLLAPQRASRRGGNPPAPACPRRGKRERGRSDSLLPQANSFVALALPLPSRSPVQGRLNALAPEHLEVVHCLLPMLDRVPLGAHVPQCQIQQLYRRILARE